MPTTGTSRKNSVAVQYGIPRRGVPSAARLRRWAALAPAEVTVRVVGEREGRRLNHAFRGKPQPTNVLSFAYGRARGDIVLCHPVIRREARAQGKSVAAHYAHLLVHGLLHLRGYDHASRRQAARMERAEVRLLARAGFPDPYTVE